MSNRPKHFESTTKHRIIVMYYKKKVLREEPWTPFIGPNDIQYYNILKVVWAPIGDKIGLQSNKLAYPSLGLTVTS